ncbi:hypothetical protein CDIK_1930 [Cucumispora dikerogammari]|nr:hypothetical protein CDIK_1930 [Cucumispora dikerogammari]
MIMFCKTCGSLLAPEFIIDSQNQTNTDSRSLESQSISSQKVSQNTITNNGILKMTCNKCGISELPESHVLSFTNFVDLPLNLNRQEIKDLVTSSLPVLSNKTHCKNKEVAFFETDFIGETEGGFGVKFVCLGCFSIVD